MEFVELWSPPKVLALLGQGGLGMYLDHMYWRWAKFHPHRWSYAVRWETRWDGTLQQSKVIGIRFSMPQLIVLGSRHQFFETSKAIRSTWKLNQVFFFHFLKKVTIFIAQELYSIRELHWTQKKAPLQKHSTKSGSSLESEKLNTNMK